MEATATVTPAIPTTLPSLCLGEGGKDGKREGEDEEDGRREGGKEEGREKGGMEEDGKGEGERGRKGQSSKKRRRSEMDDVHAGKRDVTLSPRCLLTGQAAYSSDAGNTRPCTRNPRDLGGREGVKGERGGEGEREERGGGGGGEGE